MRYAINTKLLRNSGGDFSGWILLRGKISWWILAAHSSRKQTRSEIQTYHHRVSRLFLAFLFPRLSSESSSCTVIFCSKSYHSVSRARLSPSGQFKKMSLQICLGYNHWVPCTLGEPMSTTETPTQDARIRCPRES